MRTRAGAAARWRATWCALAVLALAAAAPASAGALWKPPGTRYCGLQGGTHNSLIDRVFVRNVTCATGKRVIRLTKSSATMRGWDCRLHTFADGSEGSRCVKGSRKRVYGIPTDRDAGI